MHRAFKWPLAALWVWAAAWGLALALKALQAPWWACVGLPTLFGVMLALVPRLASSHGRRLWVAAGFPLSLLALTQGAQFDPFWWALSLGVMLLVYPLGAWRDAPMVPTPRDALDALPAAAPLPQPTPRVLDVGCGMGHALMALRRSYPHAHLEGVERSWLWHAVATWRCRWAVLHRQDMWSWSWADYDLVYLYQRPESMWRAWCKAQSDMKPGAWLVSLDYPVVRDNGRALTEHARLTLATGRVVWVYRLGAAPRA